MALLDETLERLSLMEHQRDQALSELAALRVEHTRLQETTYAFNTEEALERILNLEALACTTILREEIVGLWARIANLESQLLSFQRGERGEG